MSHLDVAIAGGGIIGLATALELAAAGRKVTAFDKGEAMSEASRAAAGMLAGNDPENPRELRALARLSLALYPEFLSRVERLSGVRVPIRTTRTLQGVKHATASTHILSEAEVQVLAPGADTTGWHFFLLHEQSFDAWDLAECLPTAVRAAGVELRDRTSIVSVRENKTGVHLDTTAGAFSASSFLNAAGAWSPQLDPSLPVVPRKGHMLTAELPGPVQMDCVLRTDNVYIVPRGQGRYTIGPTLEDAGFDKEIYADRIHGLFQKAIDLWPVLRDARIAETWTGLRPGSDDGLPILDRTGDHRWVATGHFKNGIMLAPGTARVVSQWILGAKPSIDLSPFRCARFDTAAVSS